MRADAKPWLPDNSYEYGVPDDDRFTMHSMKEMEADMAMQRRNRNVLVLADKVYRTEWGGVERVKRPPLINGRRWQFLEKW